MASHYKWEDTYIEHLQIHGVTSIAAEEAGTSAHNVMGARKRNKRFAAREYAAKERALDGLEKKAMSLASEGEVRMIQWILARMRTNKWADPEKRIKLDADIRTDSGLSEIEQMIAEVEDGPVSDEGGTELA